jgi:predicted CoA-binding protein
MSRERVVILGASDKPDRYAFKALKMLQIHGHEVIPVHPSLAVIEGIPVTSHLEAVIGLVDTVTVYIRPELSAPLLSALIALRPKRVIFNPGTESEPMRLALDAAGIKPVEACTLVMLQTGQYGVE